MDNGIEILKKFELKYWTTKDNKRIQIKDLDIVHLKNIVNLLQRKFDSAINPMNDYPSLFQGEMAQMYAQQQWDHSIKEYESLKRTLKLFKVYYKLKTL